MIRARQILSSPVALSLLVPLSGDLRAAALFEESYAIAAGWNLIHIPVEPLDKDPRTALGAIAWESLWTWIPDPAAARGGRWVAVHSEAPAFLRSLFSFTGPNSYLLLARTAGTLRIRGAVRPGSRSLAGGAYQLFGPSVDRANPPTAAMYFWRAGVKEHIGPLFELAGQSYRRVADGDRLRAGAAYWVFPDQGIPAPDPLRLGSATGGLRFGPQAALAEVVIDVGAPGGSGGGAGVARQFRVSAVPSAGGAGGTDWLELGRADGTFASFSGGALLEASPGESMLRVTFRARSGDVAPDPGTGRAAVVEVSAAEGKVMLGAELEVPGLEGTWLGEATITEVARAQVHGGGYAAVPTVPISLILDLSEAAQPRLVPCASMETFRDGRRLSYRFEAALFHKLVVLTGALAEDGKTGTLTGTIAMPADHALNPYRHRYHPEHAAGYDLTRTLRLRFGAAGPEPAIENPFATVGVLSGVYEEDVEGMAPEPLRLRGSFQLRRLTGGAANPCSQAAP